LEMISKLKGANLGCRHSRESGNPAPSSNGKALGSGSPLRGVRNDEQKTDARNR